VVATLAATAIIMVRRRRLVPAIASTEEPTTARAKLLAGLAELDRRRAAGKLSANAYAAAQAQIRDTLIEVRIRESTHRAAK
jgi:hypothetical protein